MAPRVSPAKNGRPAPKVPRSSTRRTLVTTELLDQATQIFASKGYEATSLQDIADAMGISRPALYHYVSSKEDLLGMLVDQVSHGLADELTELAQREDLTAAQKLRELTGLLVLQRVLHPAQFRVLDQSEAVLPEPAASKHWEAKRTVLRQLITIIDSGIRSGEFHSVDSRIAAFSVLGMCNWVAWWAKSNEDVDAIVAAITDFTARMLTDTGHRPAAGPSDVLRDIRRNLDWLERQF